MSKKNLFDDDPEEEEVRFKTENEYAKKYDNWRGKEELHKLEQKYGSKALSSDASASSDSEDESDEPPEVSEEMEKQFLKTLALLKTGDPRIYDPNFTCFDEKQEKVEEEKPKTKTLTFEDSDDDDESDDGNIFKVEIKAEIGANTNKKTSDGDDKKTKKEGRLKDFLTGKSEHIDEDVEQDLAPLKALWSDPKLNEGEAFLRDYILNKRYLEEGDVGEAEDRIRDDEDLEEDEKRVEEQGKFERAYNFRFEEPDDEYLKRYPRTVSGARPTDERRSKKRVEVRTRKEEEKQRKMEEIARMKALKLREIQEKIARIKEVTGNEALAFQEEDIEGDFDPQEHDRRMKALFDEEFYGGADDEKPVFPDLDEELEIENWENYQQEDIQGGSQGAADEGPHCEDDDFNMDADYDPKQARATLQQQIEATLGNKRRNRKRKSKLAELLATDKPKFVPDVVKKTYDEYMEEYYKMECEDVIGGDLPTRFKYREVVPNDFGLTVEEILLADDKELTQWVPLKKIVKHRAPDVEKSEVNTYRQKAADVRLKKKILPSLFKDLPENPEIVVPIAEATKKKKKKKRKNNKEQKTEQQPTEETEQNEGNIVENNVENDETVDENKESSRKKKKHPDKIDSGVENVIDDNLEISPKKKKNNKKHKDSEVILDTSESKRKDKKHLDRTDSNVENVTEDSLEISPKKKKNKKHKDSEVVLGTSEVENLEETIEIKNKSKGKKNAEVSADSKETDSLKETVIQLNGTKEHNKNRKKKNYPMLGGFVVEDIQKEEPSQAGHEGVKNKHEVIKQQNKGKVNLKRKLDQQHQVPNKKHKKFDAKGKNKSNFKQTDKFKNKQGKPPSDNPFSQLSDERLKAYGLNPKKYKNFLKYKKF